MKTDNELIAEFMGLVETKYRLTPLHKYNKYWCIGSKDGFGFAPHALEYDTSWNWLMPVFDKIEILHLMGSDPNAIPFATSITERSISIYPKYNSMLRFEISFVTAPSKIHSAHRCIVQFIKWFNEQKENGRI